MVVTIRFCGVQALTRFSVRDSYLRGMGTQGALLCTRGLAWHAGQASRVDR